MRQRAQFSRLLAVVSFLMVFACNKDLTTNEGDDHAIKKAGTEGLILFTGEIAVDGCGYMLKLEDHLYKPINLPASFEIDSLKVIVNYELTQDGYQCGLSPTPKTTIKINEIKKNN